MPICKICHVERQLKPLNERTSVIGVPIKTWHCEKCGFKRWPLTEEEYAEWDKQYAEQIKKPLKKKKKTKPVFYSLLNRDDDKVTRRYHTKEPGGCGNCSCDSNKSDGCSGGGCSGGGCGGCGHP